VRSRLAHHLSCQKTDNLSCLWCKQAAYCSSMHALGLLLCFVTRFQCPFMTMCSSMVRHML
jgi:hypothetical protein